MFLPCGSLSWGRTSTRRVDDSVELLIRGGYVGGSPIGCGGLEVMTVGCGPANPGSIPGRGPHCNFEGDSIAIECIGINCVPHPFSLSG